MIPSFHWCVILKKSSVFVWWGTLPPLNTVCDQEQVKFYVDGKDKQTPTNVKEIVESVLQQVCLETAKPSAGAVHDNEKFSINYS